MKTVLAGLNGIVFKLLRAASIVATAAVALMALATFPADAAELAKATAVVEVHIVKMKFEPQQIKVKAGSTVKWINMEKRNNHSVFFEKEGLPESERFFPGESWQRTFDKPGVYPYICGPHPEMTGEVQVVE